MIKTTLIFIAAVLSIPTIAQKKGSAAATHNTIAINAADSKETIINKAAQVVPTPNQYSALKNGYIAFVHFGPNTFTRKEWGNGMEDPKIFDLKELHTDQWCEAMKAAGMKMVILTVKHHDGFVLWQSRYTQHGIMSTSYKNGQGDILKELTASCRKYGLKVGVYLSPADLYQIENPEGLYGNLSKYTKRTIPRAVQGRPFKNKTTFQFEADDYNEYFMNQLFELLTEYGPIHEVWFDGAHPKRKGNQQYNYLAWKKIIRTLAPEAVIFGKEDIRWCGNESGGTRNTEWNVIPYKDDPNQMNSFADVTDASPGSSENLYKAKFLHYQPAETNTSIREGWFYRDDVYQKVRNADDVFDIYERSVGGNSIFLLNIPPNREGKFSPADVASLKEAGRRISTTYSNDLFKNAKGPVQVLDENDKTFLLLNKQPAEIIITTPAAITINRLMLQEAIATHGERVEQHAMDAWINNEWKEIITATNIGYKRILRFPQVTASKFRIRVVASRLRPAISQLSAYFYKTPPPALQFSRDIHGQVTIEPVKGDFGWKPHGQNIARNLYQDFDIFYTTDGSEPGTQSQKYTAPVLITGGILKATAFEKNEKGSMAEKHFGIVKQDWKLLAAAGENVKQKGALAFDENKKTYWQSGNDAASQFISIDLGKEYTIKGVAYTPQSDHADGMIENGIIKISADGVNWQDAAAFEFGNLINDPTTRTLYFPKPFTSRYIRVEARRLAGNGKTAAIAELDFFEE